MALKVKSHLSAQFDVKYGHHGGYKMKLQIGQMAPDFTLPGHLGKDVTLSDLRGKNVVLAFFPMAWTPI